VKFVDEYQNPEQVRDFARRTNCLATRRWTIMEVCGGQTHAILKYGLDQLFAEKVELLHGPGCPVCVTPISLIDKAVEIAQMKDVIFCSFGDMVRVPGSERSLLSARAMGGDVRIVYSPLEAVNLAQAHPHSAVVFFGIGFETTAPTTALAILEAERRQLKNFYVLAAMVLIPPAMEAILSTPHHNLHGFLAAGHVCTVSGMGDYQRLADKFRIPVVITGFEPLDIAQGIYMVVAQLERGAAVVENQYARSVRAGGNDIAQMAMQRVFRVVDRQWRGFGLIPNSGLALASTYAAYDAEKKFGAIDSGRDQLSECISGQILQGVKKPFNCPAFGGR